DDRSLKTCFGSRNFGSMNFGARKPRQTTKISADTFLGTVSGAEFDVGEYNHAPGRRRLGSFDLFEQLIEHPDEVVVVHTTEDLRNERSSLDEELDGELQTHEHEL